MRTRLGVTRHLGLLESVGLGVVYELEQERAMPQVDNEVLRVHPKEKDATILTHTHSRARPNALRTSER